MGKLPQKLMPVADRNQFAVEIYLPTGFAHPYVTLLGGIASVLVGIFLMGKLPQKLMPVADRNQFAVEIYLPTGSAVEKTAWAADTMEHVFRKDPRVTSVTSFIGCSSPRFHTAYAPQLGGTNYAQLIVNTKGNKETVELLDEYAPRYTDAFPAGDFRHFIYRLFFPSFPYGIRSAIRRNELRPVDCKHERDQGNCGTVG